MKMLIVEDDVTSRNMLADLLRDYGTIDIAENGHEAIEMYHRAISHSPYQLICLDILLPGYHGDQILKIIRQTERLRQIKKDPAVVLMTSSVRTAEEVKNAIKMGCDGYLAKPYDSSNLFKILVKKRLIPPELKLNE